LYRKEVRAASGLAVVQLTARKRDPLWRGELPADARLLQPRRDADDWTEIHGKRSEGYRNRDYEGAQSRYGLGPRHPAAREGAADRRLDGIRVRPGLPHESHYELAHLEGCSRV